MPWPSPPTSHSFIGFHSQEAGNLAHDLSGLVQVAALKLDLLKARTEIDLDTMKLIHDLDELLKKMSLVTDSALSTTHSNPVTTLEPGEVIENTVALVRALGGKRITIEVNNSSQNIWVPIPQSHLQQVVFNLVRSAMEALPYSGGRVVVSANIRERGNITSCAPWVSRQSLLLTVEGHCTVIGRVLRPWSFWNPFGLPRKGQQPNNFHCQKLLDIYGGTITYDQIGKVGSRARIVWPF